MSDERHENALDPQKKYVSFLLLFSSLLFLLACSLTRLGLNRSEAPSDSASAATITTLMLENARLTAQLATADAHLAAAIPTTAAAIPTVAPQPPTATPNPTVVHIPPTATSIPALLPLPATATPPPKASEWKILSVMFSPKRPTRLYALQLHHTAVVVRLMISDDIGQSWQTLLNSFPVETSCLNDLNLDYNVPDTFYASTCRGLYRWTDGKWDRISSGQTGTVATVPEKPRLFWAAEPFGPTEVPIFRSENEAGTWTPASRYLNHTNGVATLLIDPLDNERLFAVIWPEFAGSHLRRGSANGQWADLPTPLDNSPIGTRVVIDGATGVLYAVVNSNQLWRSRNPNEPNVDVIRWELVHDFGQGFQVELLGAGWRQGHLALFVNLTDVNQQVGLPAFHRSLDWGQSWTPLPVE